MAARMQAQATAIAAPPSGPPAYGAVSSGTPAAASVSLYPSLDGYMGLDMSPQNLEKNMPDAVATLPSQTVATRGNGGYSSSVMVAPVSGNDKGIMRAEIQQGIREVIVCKDQDGKIGLRVKSVDKGVFVAFVHKDSAAALAGLRFGDQILQINGQSVAGWDTDKTMDYLRKANEQRISMAVRDRPFERTITMQKNSTGHIGFVFKENKITAIVQDSSAAKNGVLINHHLVEVNGQNVVGMKEKEIKAIIEGLGRTITITLIPSYIYEHIIKSMGSSLVKKFMDHSVPDV
jgi:syntenin-1